MAFGCPALNSKVACLMLSLSLYGVLLIAVSNQSINPLYFITSIRNHYLGPPRLLAFNSSIDMHNHSDISIMLPQNTSKMMSTSRLTVNTTTIPATMSPEDNKTNSTEVPLVALPATPLLTLFSTFKNSPGKSHLYQNTIRNWQLLRPWVRSILFTVPEETGMSDFARKHGWIVLPVPKKSAAKVPILRHMFLAVQEKYNSSYYGYANGDMMFDKRLVDTLTEILPAVNKMKQVLIVGRRTNVKLLAKQEIRTLREVAELGSHGKLFGTNAEDYFITKAHGYPWQSIPDFVIGRVGYDNWLVVTALVKKIFTIDMTKTVMAVHQTDTDGNFAGHSKKPSGDTYINYALAGKRFDYSLGHVTCGQFYTDYQKGKPALLERDKNRCEKIFRHLRLNPYVKIPRRRMRLLK